ncbi:TetR/AcrR family transcriptional regulator [Clostridioides difficile]|nr:TetR/AcrR family transcriptional regulator [Clostridioides difficile]
MDKKELILNAMQELLKEEKGATCSVSDIAKKAGIGKGSIYYYFKSKDEIFDAVVEHTYKQIIDKCKAIVDKSQLDSISKLMLLFQSYVTSTVESSIDEYLHQQFNASIHQKSLAKILTSLSPIVAEIFQQGVKEGLFECEYTLEISEIILSVFTFLLDPGIFTWDKEERNRKLKALSLILERTLIAPKGSFDFFTNDF